MEARITRDPAIMVGKPCVRGTRISVEVLLEYLGKLGSLEAVLDLYPQLTRADLLAAITYAAEHLGDAEPRAAG